MPTLVIKPGSRLGIGLDVGWRIKKKDFERDLMWGNTKNDDSLKLLIKDLEKKHGEIDIIDLRKK